MFVDFIRKLTSQHYMYLSAFNLTSMGVFAGYFYFDLLASVQSRPQYKHAIKLLESNETVKAELGAPIVIKNFDVFNKENFVKEDIACIHVPVSGSNRKGSYFIWAEKEDDVWSIKTARVNYEDGSESKEIYVVDVDNAVVVANSE